MYEIADFYRIYFLCKAGVFCGFTNRQIKFSIMVSPVQSSMEGKQASLSSVEFSRLESVTMWSQNDLIQQTWSWLGDVRPSWQAIDHIQLFFCLSSINLNSIFIPELRNFNPSHWSAIWFLSIIVYMTLGLLILHNARGVCTRVLWRKDGWTSTRLCLLYQDLLRLHYYTWQRHKEQLGCLSCWFLLENS